MNLLPSPEQSEIVDALRAFLAEQAPVARFRPPARQTGNDDARLWSGLGQLGFVGIAVAESHGGIGLGAVEEVLAFCEFGRHLVSPAVLALTQAAPLAARSDHMDLLAGLLEGRSHVGLANPRGSVQIGAECSGEFHLFDADGAEWVLVSTEQATALLRRDQFQSVEPVLGTDNVLTLQRARLQGVRPVLLGADGALYQRSLLLAAAYAVGMAEATRDMAVEYAKVREQFNKPIGSFQAVKHLCADMAIRAEAALCQLYMAALVVAEGNDGADFHVASAKIVATKAALDNAAANIQVHGAFGFTSEADAHLYLKRSHMIDQWGGDLRCQRERLLSMPLPEAA